MESAAEYVELPGRVKLAYVEHGDKSGVPVVLLHGITDSLRSFEPVLPHLPASMRAFALSQRGHGDSERPATNYHPRDFAADVAAFMDALNLERAVIVGHSMGSYVAQQFAINYPERTLGLVLIGSFVKCHDKPDLVEYCDTAVNSLTDPVPVDFAREFQESTLARPVPPEFLAMVIEESLKVPARVWQAAFRGLLEADHSGELDKIQAPTLILWGERDAYFPESDQHTLASRIRDARLVVYPGTGHALHWEESARFATDLADFVKSLHSPKHDAGT